MIHTSICTQCLARFDGDDGPAKLASHDCDPAFAALVLAAREHPGDLNRARAAAGARIFERRQLCPRKRSA